MEDRLLVRVYSVGFGDCIYVRIPDGDEHGETNPVPYPPLMRELGRLSTNRRRYRHDPDPTLRTVSQPQRTDLEPRVVGRSAHYLEVLLEPESQ